MTIPRASAIVSTVFGIGYFPQAQGTIMSAIAVPLAILLALHGGAMVVLGGALVALVIGILSCSEYVRETGNPDPSECVIDELAGQWLACAFVAFAPLSLPAFFLSFGLFRLFDIWKPWPVYLAETKLHGGLAVMMDDIVAGLMAGGLAFIIHYYHWL
jgi:phosphatidylglycerophosphatase A